MAEKEIENDLKTIIGQNAELIYSQVFHDTIKGSEWLPGDFPFSPGRGALGYPALYVLYRILDEIRPQSVLEMGMGQSTKMIALYNHKHKECRHCVVEHDQKWIDFFCNHFELPGTTEVVQLPITDIPVTGSGKPQNVTVYAGFEDRFRGKKFDFICIDGPYGFRSPEFSRIDIVSILPECLNEQFVILLDDCQRVGEMNTLRLITQILKEKQIKYSVNVYEGEKHTGLVVSEDLSFLCTM